MDGSSFIQKGIRWAGAAVVSLTETLSAEPLPPSTSAQLAELIALTKALQLREKLPTSIQTLNMLSWSCMPSSPLERVRIVNYWRIPYQTLQGNLKPLKNSFTSKTNSSNSLARTSKVRGSGC
jgi:hypothetical protein